MVALACGVSARQKASTARFYGRFASRMPREEESEQGSLLRSLCIADARARKKASTARFYGRFASRMPREEESEHGSLLRSLCIADAARRRKRARLASTVALHRGCRAKKKASTARFYGRFASRMPREEESEHGSLLRSLCIADAARRRKRARLASTVALHRGCRAKKKASTARFYGRFASRMPREEESEHGSLLRSLCIADAARRRKRARLASTVALHRGCRAGKKASRAYTAPVP